MTVSLNYVDFSFKDIYDPATVFTVDAPALAVSATLVGEDSGTIQSATLADDVFSWNHTKLQASGWKYEAPMRIVITYSDLSTTLYRFKVGGKPTLTIRSRKNGIADGVIEETVEYDAPRAINWGAIWSRLAYEAEDIEPTDVYDIRFDFTRVAANLDLQIKSFGTGVSKSLTLDSNGRLDLRYSDGLLRTGMSESRTPYIAELAGVTGNAGLIDLWPQGGCSEVRLRLFTSEETSTDYIVGSIPEQSGYEELEEEERSLMTYAVRRVTLDHTEESLDIASLPKTIDDTTYLDLGFRSSDDPNLLTHAYNPLSDAYESFPVDYVLAKNPDISGGLEYANSLALLDFGKVGANIDGINLRLQVSAGAYPSGINGGLTDDYSLPYDLKGEYDEPSLLSTIHLRNNPFSVSLMGNTYWVNHRPAINDLNVAVYARNDGKWYRPRSGTFTLWPVGWENDSYYPSAKVGSATTAMAPAQLNMADAGFTPDAYFICPVIGPMSAIFNRETVSITGASGTEELVIMNAGEWEGGSLVGEGLPPYQWGVYVEESEFNMYDDGTYTIVIDTEDLSNGYSYTRYISILG